MWSKLIQEHQVLGLMLFLGLLVGMIFIYIVPPWQHYDEPTHFEYTWLIANRSGIPDKGEYDQSMRREVAASMVENDFFHGMDFNPNLISSTEPVWIGISQSGSSSIYYWLAANPLRILRTTDVTFQLYVLRYVSLIFYLITIAAAYAITAELTPPKHPLRWLLPATILLLPSFVDLLTAVNDDVGATAFFSLFLWSGTRLIIRGFHWFRLVVFVLLAVICFYTKTTVMIAVILMPIPLLFSIIRGRKRRYLWIALFIGLILMAASLFTWGTYANWYQFSSSGRSTRSFHNKSPSGKYVFKFLLSPEASKNQIGQLMTTLGEGSAAYTIGAWIWADQPATVQMPFLQVGDDLIAREVEVNTEPKFYSISKSIEAGSPIKIFLSPTKIPPDEPLTVYYDGLLVIEGTWPEDSYPIFNDSNAKDGIWGGKEFTNLVRNPSAEISQLRLRNWVENILTKRFPGNPALTFGLLLDPTPIKSYYQATFKLLFQTFWARFGWAHVLLAGYRPYTILGLFTMAGLIGALVAFWRNRKEIRWEVFLFLGLALITVWGAALLRGLTSLLDGDYLIPVARYAYPVIIPTMLILSIGWLDTIRWIERYIKIPRKMLLAILILFFVILDMLSIYSIYQFYA